MKINTEKLFAKRKYFMENPEEGFEEFLKRDDGITTVAVKKDATEKSTISKQEKALDREERNDNV